MDNRTIAVDDELGNVRQALEQAGYQVVGLKDGLENAAAIILSGMDDALMGIQAIKSQAPVIEADGLSAEEVLNEIKERTRIQ